MCPSLLPVPPLLSLTAPGETGSVGEGERERTGGKGAEACLSVCRRETVEKNVRNASFSLNVNLVLLTALP